MEEKGGENSVEKGDGTCAGWVFCKEQLKLLLRKLGLLDSISRFHTIVNEYIYLPFNASSFCEKI